MSRQIKIKKINNFTVLSNKLLRDNRLSFKAKGLMCFMLSLPPDWDYTVKGLAVCAKDGIDSITSALNELKKYGYLTTGRERKNNGQLGKAIYIIREDPDAIDDEYDGQEEQEEPKQENQEQAGEEIENQIQGIPIWENQIQENQAQLNTKQLNTKLNNNINKNILSGCPDDEEKPVEVVEAEVISDGRIVQPKKKSISESIVEIVEYLNEKAGTHYRSTTPKTQRLIKARLAEGFTVDDFKTVVDKKCADWLGDGDMVQYLRPDTLFSTKFEGYLNQREADYTKMKPILTKQDKLILQDRMRCKREERDSSEIDREFAKLFSRGGL